MNIFISRYPAPREEKICYMQRQIEAGMVITPLLLLHTTVVECSVEVETFV